eukprot:6491326-Amphidinium_carterae.7
MYSLSPVWIVVLLSLRSGRPINGDLAMMKQTCITIVSMMSVVSFHPCIVNPSHVAVTYCFLVPSVIGVIGTCSKRCDWTNTAPVSVDCPVAVLSLTFPVS